MLCTSCLCSLCYGYDIAGAVEQFEIAVETRDYKQAASLLEAIRQLMAFFDTFSHVPRVTYLRKIVTRETEKLKQQVMRDAESYVMYLSYLMMYSILGNSTAPQETSPASAPDSEHRLSVSMDPEGVFHGITSEKLTEVCLAVTALGSDAKYVRYCVNING